MGKPFTGGFKMYLFVIIFLSLLYVNDIISVCAAEFCFKLEFFEIILNNEVAIANILKTLTMRTISKI